MHCPTNTVNARGLDLIAKVPDVQQMSELCQGKGELWLHRLDQVFPLSTGNKAFKLIGHYLAAKKAGKAHFLSFGGAWSNHVHALAHFSEQVNFRSTVIIRGHYADLNNATLADAANQGMSFLRVDRQEYRQRYERAYLQKLKADNPDAWLIAEGANDRLGRWGLTLLADSLKQSIPAGDTLVVASGTGATVRGLAAGLTDHAKLVSALVVRDPTLANELKLQCQRSSPDFRLIDAAGAGYGRVSGEQLTQLQRVFEETGVLLDPLYNGKAWAAAAALADAGERVHLLHTGGLQGWRGMQERHRLAEYPLLDHAVTELAADYALALR